MNQMFYDATAFNQPVGNWNTSVVTNMSGMFWGANTFNKNIGGWDVKNVIKMVKCFLMPLPSIDLSVTGIPPRLRIW